MKTKKYFMLLAAVLLSVSAFAQSGNNEPLNGDVNGDGTVDVADMVGVIKIMKDGGGAVGEKHAYWYAGTNGGNAVTADNFTDVATKVAESEIPQTGTVTASGQYVYIVLPETRHLESLTDEGGSAVEFTCTDVMGYQIYRTVGSINTKLNYTIEEITCYWYVGYDQNAYEHPESFKANMYTTNTNAVPTQYSKSGDNGLDVSGTGTIPNYLIMIIPSTWNKPTIYGQLKDAEVGMTLEKQNVTITGISEITFNVYSGTGEMSDSKVFIN